MAYLHDIIFRAEEKINSAVSAIKIRLVGSTGTGVEVGSSGLEVEVKKSALPAGASTSAKQDTLLAELEKKADVTETQPVQVDALTAVYNGTKTVPTGTAEAIASSQSIHSVTIKSLSTNTVSILVGASGVTAANGFELLAGESVSLEVSNLNLVYCISGSDSQVIRYIAL